MSHDMIIAPPAPDAIRELLAEFGAQFAAVAQWLAPQLHDSPQSGRLLPKE
jgi:hypothetical protein